MNSSGPNKSSSRSGRFKKKLVGLAELKDEAPIIEERMAPILDLFHQKKITTSEYAALYIITVLSYRFPGTWCGAKRAESITSTHQLNYPLEKLIDHFEPNIRKRLEGLKTIGDIFNLFSFRSTPMAVQRSILEWSNEKYGLELMFRIPTPKEVLKQQKMGRRCVTILTNKERTQELILGQRDALGFTMHDLIHADHFYHNNASFVGQLGFYSLLDHCMNENLLEDLMNNEKFVDEFEYLIADMNAYPVHLLKCFKSALVHYHPEKEIFFNSFMSALDLNQGQTMAFEKLNHDDRDPILHETLLNFLETYRLGFKNR